MTGADAEKSTETVVDTASAAESSVEIATDGPPVSSGEENVEAGVKGPEKATEVAAVDEEGHDGLDICVADEIVEFDDLDAKEAPTSSESKEATSEAVASASTAVVAALPGDAEEGEEWEPTAPPVQPLHAVGVLVGKNGALRAQSFPLVDRCPFLPILL